MKKLLLLLIAAGGAASAIAQQAKQEYRHDSLLSRWVLDINLMGGGASQSITTANTTTNYPGAVNMNTGQLNYSNGYSYGGNAQLGFFFGKKRHFGLGTGVLFMQQHGTAELDGFNASYQATDAAGNIYRQQVTGHNIKEDIVSKNVNIPLLLKYKNRFSKHWGFTADLGAVINLQMKNSYTTHANFDYEAIYKFQKGSDGGTISVYDNASAPDVNDWLITKAEFLRNNPNGNLADYFAKKRALGYSVGESMTPTTRTGHTSYTQGSVGFLIQPSFNYFLSDNVALNFGAYYMFQPFKNEAQKGYRITDGMGNYSSVMNTVTETKDQSYGVNLGVRFFLGKGRTLINIASAEAIAPTQCGACDGSISLTGLTPNQPVTVDYSLNGKQQSEYATNVQPDGKVKISGLCAGDYTGIVAKIKKEKAAGKPVILADPTIRISAQKATNPTVQGTCDGSIQFSGLYAGKTASVSYSFNGTSQPVFVAVVNADRTITMSNLCEGNYTGIVATLINCTANGTDVMLTAPVPVVPIKTTTTTVVSTDLEYEGKNIDISTPIMFEVNKTVVHSSSYPVIDNAAEKMKENKSLNITIDGHADASGSEAFNRTLSLGRANSVKNELTKRGINPKRLKTRGHGSKVPAATNSTYEGKKENRRAVMTPTLK
jgi:outer membrane protein OmpA-like peptidoglycan-associated protein